MMQALVMMCLLDAVKLAADVSNSFYCVITLTQSRQ